MAIIRYVSDDEGGNRYFAIVADDTKAEYVWPMDDEEEAWFEGDERLAMLLSFESVETPTTAEEWIDLASYNLGWEIAFEDEEVVDFETARTTAYRGLIKSNPPNPTPGYSPKAGSDAADWKNVQEEEVTP